MEKLNVAIADDNERMLRLLGAIIESDEELNVVGTAKDGEEAYNVIKTKEPDVVLLDIVMPKLDGLGVLDRVNHDKTIKKHPTFIMISAIGQEKITEDLNQVIIEQGRMIDRLVKQNQYLMNLAEQDTVKPLSEETPPPHY